MIKYRYILALLAFGLMSNSTVLAQSRSYSNETFTLQSSTVGEEFLIEVSLPSDYRKGDQTYPVLYVTDGNAVFDFTADVMRSLAADTLDPGMPRVIVVGISYQDASTWFAKRQRDLTPEGAVPPDADEFIKQRYPDVQLDRYRGGADAFLAFIRDTLDPKIRSSYRTDGKPAGLVGVSWGGMFGLHALTKREPLFDRYWLGSIAPIEMVDDHIIKDFQASLVTGNYEDVRVFLSVGEKEIGHPLYGHGVAGVNEVLMAINGVQPEGLAARLLVVPDATHGGSKFMAAPAAMRFLYHPEYRD